MSNVKRLYSNFYIDSPIAPPVYSVSTHPTMSSQAYYGRSYSHSTGVYVFSEITLKTRMKAVARKDRKASFLKLFRMALKMLVSSDMSVKISKRWMVYHSTPTKLPIRVATTNIRIDRNPD